MLNRISSKCGQALGSQLAFNSQQVEVLQYGALVALENLIEIIIIVAFSVVFKIEATVLLVFLTYASFRVVGGGAHLSTYPRCLGIGTLIIIGIGWLSTFELGKATANLLLVTTGLLALMSIILWIPAGTEKRPITDKVVRRQQKIIAVIILAIWAGGEIYLTRWGYWPQKQAITYGALAALVFITPAGYKIMSSMDGALNRLTGKEV